MNIFLPIRSHTDGEILNKLIDSEDEATNKYIASVRIQRCFRCFVSRRKFKFTLRFRNRFQLNSNGDSTHVERSSNGLSASFERLASGTASSSDKLTVWRGILELRRAHDNHRIDLLVKALIESKGNLRRSISLLGTKYFVTRNDSNLPLKVRRKFIPHVFGGVANTPEVVHINGLKTKEMPKTYESNKNQLNSANRLETIRNLRNQQVTNPTNRTPHEAMMERKKELFDRLNNVLMKGLFAERSDS